MYIYIHISYIVCIYIYYVYAYMYVHVCIYIYVDIRTHIHILYIRLYMGSTSKNASPCVISKICQVAASEASQPQTEVALAGQRTKPWVTPFFFFNDEKSMEILKYHGNIMEIWKILENIIDIIMEHIMDV